MGLLKIIFAPIRFIFKLLKPKVKKNKPDAVKDLESPTADRSRPIPVPFGTMTIKSPNVLHFGDKSRRTYKTKA
jgi:hypothetical protein